MFKHKTSLNQCKKTEIISSVFSDYTDVKLEINYKKKVGGKKPPQICGN